MFIQIKNVEELLQKLREIPGSQVTHGEASFGYSFELKDGSKLLIGQTDTDVSEGHLFWIQLINKPVETTKEQPKMSLDLKMQLMEIMCKHVELRNSDKLTDRDLYHAFLDWEKEVWKLL